MGPTKVGHGGAALPEIAGIERPSCSSLTSRSEGRAGTMAMLLVAGAVTGYCVVTEVVLSRADGRSSRASLPLRSGGRPWTRTEGSGRPGWMSASRGQ